MSIALDYTTRIDPAALKSAGISDVFRYLAWPYYWGGQTHSYPNPKIIQKAEYDELVAAGIGVTLNWEYDGRDWLSGASGGAAHAAEAVRQARALGYPAGSTIPGSADLDMTRAQWDAAGKAYGAAYRDGIRAGGYRPGVYGPSDVLAWCRDDLGYDMAWQCMSTSFSGGRNGRDWPGAHLRQVGYKTVGGVVGDWNRILVPDWGQARSGGTDVGTLDGLQGVYLYNVWKILEGFRSGDLAVPQNTGTDAGGPVASIDLVPSKILKDLTDGVSALRELPARILTDADRAAIVAGLATSLPTASEIAAELAAQLPKPPTAAQIAEEMAARLGNG